MDLSRRKIDASCLAAGMACLVLALVAIGAHWPGWAWLVCAGAALVLGPPLVGLAVEVVRSWRRPRPGNE